MNIFLAAVQLLSIILICIYEYKKKCLSVFLWAVLLVMFGIPHFISIIFSINEFSYDTLLKASLFVLAFNCLYIFTKIAIMSMFKTNLRNKTVNAQNINIGENMTSIKKDEYLMKLFFMLLIVSFLILLSFIFKYLGSITVASWGSLYKLTNELGFRSSLKYGNVIFFATAGIILSFMNNNKKIKFICSFSIVILYALITGNRITILPALVSLIIPIIYDKNKKITLKKALVISLIGFFSIYLVYALRLLRIYGGVYNFINAFDLTQMNNQVFNMMINGDGELALRKVFYYFIDINNDFPNFNSGHTYIRLLLMPIPTSLSFGVKPPDFAITMGSAELNDIYNTTYSTHPTLYGDVFANLWWFGIMLAMFWALITVLIDIYVNRKNRVVKNMLLVLFGTVYVIVGRGSVYNGFFIGYSGSVIIGVTYLLSKFRVSLR